MKDSTNKDLNKLKEQAVNKFVSNAKIGMDMSDAVAYGWDACVKAMEKKKTRVIKKTKPVLSHIDIPPLWNVPKFKIAWQEWLQYKLDSFNFRYKTKVSEDKALTHLESLSSGVMEFAISIIDRSIANGWKGLFPLDKKGRPAASKIISKHSDDEYGVSN